MFVSSVLSIIISSLLVYGSLLCQNMFTMQNSNNYSVLQIGADMTNSTRLCHTTRNRVFRSFFGSHRAAAACWVKLAEHYNHRLTKRHMLWTLYYFQKNPTNEEAVQFLNCHVQTFTYWRDYHVELICHLPVVCVIKYYNCYLFSY